MTRKKSLLAAFASTTALCAGQAMAQDRTVLPIAPAPFTGTIGDTVATSQAGPAALQPVRAPQGAPNVFLFLSDDVGFAMTSAFGGPVPTPNFERMAQAGQRYNRFHTTGICSPTRAALLTGRNHHNTGTGMLSDLPSSYPGYTGRIGADTATIAQVLRLNGYSTAMFGKHHNSPASDRSLGAGHDTWPTGLGFDYFYGFNGGDNDQYAPTLYRDRQLAHEDDNDKAGKLLDRRLADDIISYVHNQKAGNPRKPFLVYFAPGSAHAPHQAPKDISRASRASSITAGTRSACSPGAGSSPWGSYRRAPS